MTEEHARILLVHKNVMCVNKQDKEMYNIAIKAIEDNSQYKEKIQAQDEMIRALINAQETLQKEINRLKNAYKQCAWEMDALL